MPRFLIGSLLLGALLGAACSSPLVHDLDEAEANQTLALLQQRGINAEKLRSVEGNRTTYTIQVGRAQAASAWQVLRQENLPRPRPPGVNELFGKPGLVPTAIQERTLAHHALSGELARTLQTLDGVLEARVHLVLVARDPLSPPDAPAPSPRASVLLRLAPGSATVDRQEVQQLVAGAVEGLRAEAVTVVMNRTSVAPAAAGSTELARLGPFQVGSGSRSALRGVLIGGVALVLLLSLALVLILRRHRALLRTGTAAPAPSPDAVPANLESSLGLLGRSMASRPGSQAQASRSQGARDESLRR